MLGVKDKGGMSVTWIEHFGAFGMAAKRQGAIAFRESQQSRKLGATAVFATAQVQKILDAGTGFSKQLRVVYDPVPGNSGHAEIRHFEDDDLQLLDLLASDVFSDIDHVASLRLPKP
jgi:glucokinase